MSRYTHNDIIVLLFNQEDIKVITIQQQEQTGVISLVSVVLKDRITNKLYHLAGNLGSKGIVEVCITQLVRANEASPLKVWL